MKLAIITLTPQGEKLAKQLSQKLENDPTVLQVDLYHKQVQQTLNKIFQEYDCILGIMASGIMIRSICHLLEDKTKDPSILVMDEKAAHVVSILSGHLGGGNSFTIKIAELIGAEPVITTATDVNCKMGIDTLARKYFMELDKPSSIVYINKALVNHKKVKLAVPAQFEYLFDDELVKKTYAKISSSDKLEACFNETKIILTPRRIVFGVGARKGVSTESVLSAVDRACQDLGIPPERIDFLSTAEPKKNESGILEAAEKLGVELEVVSLNKLKKFDHPDVSESPFVRKTFGVPGICEPVALYVAGEQASLIYRKTSFNKVTVAVAVSSYLLK